MGLKPQEVKAVTLKEFNLMLTGYVRREEKKWDHTRHLMSFMLNYGGMGAKEFHRAQDILPLAMDKEDEKRMITTMKMAMQLYKEFEP